MLLRSRKTMVFHVAVFLGQNGDVKEYIRHSTLERKIIWQDPADWPSLNQFGTVFPAVPYDALTSRHGAFNRYPRLIKERIFFGNKSV
jgi:hypothetical protein